IEDLHQARATVALILPAGRNRWGLTAGLLRHAQQASLARPAPVETLDHERLGFAERLDGGGVDGKPESLEELQAIEFVFDAVLQIDAVGQLADLRLEDVGRRCCADRLAPAPAVPEQRGLLLRAGNGDTEVVVAAQAKRRLPKAAQQLFDGRLIDRIALDRGSARVGFIGKKLERADAV